MSRPTLIASGEILDETKELFKNAIVDMIKQCPPPADYVIDMTAVTVCSSSGIGTLLGASKRVNAAKGKIIVVLSNEGHNLTIRRLLKLTRLDSIVKIASPEVSQ